MSSSRRTSLNRIMQIERELRRINTEKEYLQILSNMEIMDNLTAGSRDITVGSPDDMDRTITVRRRSDEAKKVAESYELKLKRYSTRIQTLREEKERLEKQMFR